MRKQRNLANLLFFVVPAIAVITMAIIFRSSVISTLVSLVCLFGCFVNGSRWKYFFIVTGAGALCYALFALFNRYYGEAIVNGLYALPFYVIGSLVRMKNIKEGKGSGNPLERVPWIVKGLVLVAFLVGYYFLLRALGSEEVILNTIATGLVMLAIYFSVARSPWQWVFWLVDSALVAILWSPWIKGVENLPLFILNLSYIILDIYGLVRSRDGWKKTSRASTDSESMV